MSSNGGNIVDHTDQKTLECGVWTNPPINFPSVSLTLQPVAPLPYLKNPYTGISNANPVMFYTLLPAL